MPSKKKVKFEGIAYEGNIEELIIQALIEKQGADIQCIDLKKINHVYFDKFFWHHLKKYKYIEFYLKYH